MIVLIDNYDSFTYNLYQLIGAIEPDLQVVRNDACMVESLAAMQPDALVLSPGPGRPENAGICTDAIRYFSDKIPILGVCLGHQAICQAFGATVSYAAQLMHGKTSRIALDRACPLFAGLPDTIPVARYHSLAAMREGFPDTLQITAQAEDGEIMAVAHRSMPVYGLQFHPESVMTPDGAKILNNFVHLIRR